MLTIFPNLRKTLTDSNYNKCQTQRLILRRVNSSALDLELSEFLGMFQHSTAFSQMRGDITLKCYMWLSHLKDLICWNRNFWLSSINCSNFEDADGNVPVMQLLEMEVIRKMESFRCQFKYLFLFYPTDFTVTRHALEIVRIIGIGIGIGFLRCIYALGPRNFSP